MSGETVCRVPSLSLPEAPASVSVDALVDAEATQLFIERASAVDPAFAPTPENADAIARICRRLDGIPLAIELAAARVVVLSPEQIEARLQDRFRLLTGGARTAVARQRTLEATVDWSYQLLSDAERQLLSRLSVFPAAWTLEAAEQVCGGDGIDEHDVLDLLSRLVSKSLVVVDSECRRRAPVPLPRDGPPVSRANGSCRPAPPIGCASGISSSSSTSSAGHCPSSATTVSCRGSGDCGSSRRTSARRSNGP